MQILSGLGALEIVWMKRIWKSNEQIADNYIDCWIQSPDVKDVPILSVGSFVDYVVQEEYAYLITKTLILLFTTSNITIILPAQVALVSGCVML